MSSNLVQKLVNFLSLDNEVLLVIADTANVFEGSGFEDGHTDRVEIRLIGIEDGRRAVFLQRSEKLGRNVVFFQTVVQQLGVGRERLDVDEDFTELDLTFRGNDDVVRSNVTMVNVLRLQVEDNVEESI